MLLRLVVVVVLITAMVLARHVYLRWRARVQNETRPHPRLPEGLLGDSERTWVVFTTPYCASCEPTKSRLAASDPDATIVTVDATKQPALADAFHVRSVPTVLLAGSDGNVQERLVGAAAVSNYTRSPQ